MITLTGTCFVQTGEGNITPKIGFVFYDIFFGILFMFINYLDHLNKINRNSKKFILK